MKTAYQLINLTASSSPRKVWLKARNEWGLTSRQGNKIALSTVYRILNDPFYYGDFEYPKGSGNWIHGNHTPMITRAEFDKIQILLGNKSNPRSQTHEFAFRGPIKCGECGSSITAEPKTKKQKNGNVHFYIYYHCTKKKNLNCTQKTIEEKVLQKQISKVLSEVQLPTDFCEWALDVLKSNNVVEAQSRTQIVNNQREEYDKVVKKIDSLISMRASGQITDVEFVKNKNEFLDEKHRLDMLINDSSQRVDDWLDQAEKYFDFARTAKDIFDTTDSLEVKKGILIFLGSNLTLKDRKLNVELEKPLMLMKNALEEIKKMSEGLEPLENGLVKVDLRDLYPQNPKMLRG